MHTILVTGGAGYIGSHTALLLSQHGYNVIVIDSLLQHQTFNHPWATFVQADSADKAALSTIFSQNNVAAVVHCAALIEVGESVKHPLTFYQNNVAKTYTLLESMIEHGVMHIIFSSSCAVYGDPQFLPLTEDHPKNPISPYGRTKLMVELALQDAAVAYGLSFVNLRYFNAAGALPEHGLGERHTPESHLIPLLLRAALTQQSFSIYGNDYSTKDGTCIRDFLHVLDIAHAHVLALNHLLEGKPSDAFNLGTGIGYSVQQVAEAVERVMATPIKIVMANRRPGDPPQLVADPTRANNILQWKPRFSDLDFMIRSAHAFEMALHHRKNDAPTLIT